jgi:Restriction endonuclease
MTQRVEAQRVRYIKLGEGGEWASDCIRDGTLRIGFWTHKYHRLCLEKKWDELWRAIRDVEERSESTATRFVNEVRAVYEDIGTTLWITFHNQQMYWAFLDSSSPFVSADGHGSLRQTRAPWSGTSIAGSALRMVSLSGRLTKTEGYRGTSCDVEEPDYVIRRINDEQRPEVAKVVDLLGAMEIAVQQLVRLLTWKDFELLVDLVFATSGWRRVSAVGGSQNTVDIVLELRSTGERAFIQVKSSSNQQQFDEYRSKFEESPYDRMFYVYHSGTVTNADSDSDVTLIGPERLSTMIIQAGLISWLIEKAG